MGAKREPRKMNHCASVFPTERILREWFLERYRTDENRLRVNRIYPEAHDIPQTYIMFEVCAAAENKNGHKTDTRVGSLRLYAGEVILHVEKKFAYMFDDTEEMFRKLQT